MEHGYDQGERCLALLRQLGYADVADFHDLAGLPRVCAGTWRG
jgi:release factor glutamine methyltransferase